jgi:hypothetical protein
MFEKKSDKKDWKLEDYLTPEQQKTWRENGQIIVVTDSGRVYMLSDGRRVYVLRDGWTDSVRNVWATDPRTGEYSSQKVSLLSQLLWLQADPDWLLHQGCTDDYYSQGHIKGAPPMRGFLTVEAAERKAAQNRAKLEARRAADANLT